ncbi:polyketide synthase dehydratase domain-containing protein, partial [Burkholderia oklahomensis]
RLRLPVYPFEGERHWPTDEATPSRFALAPAGEGAYRLHIAPDAPLVADHRLAGEPVLAAAAQIVIAWRALETHTSAGGAHSASGPGESHESNGSHDSDRSNDLNDSRHSIDGIDASAATHVALHDIEWLAPIAIGAPTDLHVTLARDEDEDEDEDRNDDDDRDGDEGAARFAIAIPPAIDTPLGRGRATRAASSRSAAPAFDIAAIRARCTQPISADACYDAFAAIGIDYGPTFRPLRALAVGREEVLAEFDAAALARTTDDARLVALLDGAFQAIAGLQLADAGRIDGALLPAALARIEFVGPLADSVHAWIREVPAASGRRTFDLDLVTARGARCASLRGLALASGRRAASRDA